MPFIDGVESVERVERVNAREPAGVGVQPFSEDMTLGVPNAEVYQAKSPVPVTYDKNAPDENDEPSLMGAAFRQENLIASAVDALRPAFKEDPGGHDPLDIIKDTVYEDEFLDNFVGSRSEAETRFTMGKISREVKDRQAIADGGMYGVAASILAGTLDPTFFIPAAAPVKFFKGLRAGVNVAKTAKRGALLGGAAIGIQEAGLQYQQEIRPWQETALSIPTGVILGGILGGSIGLLSKRKIAKLTAQLDEVRAGRRLEQESIGRIAAGAEIGSTFSEAGGAALVRAEGTGRLVGGNAIKKSGLAKVSPVTRLQTSGYDSSRQIVRHMSDAGLTLADNKKGIVTSPGGTIETRVKLWSGGLYKATRTLDEAYSRYWYGEAKTMGRQRARYASEFARARGGLGGRLTRKQFGEEVFMSMSGGDRHAIPEVAEVARAMRKEVFDPLKQAAIRTGRLPENVKAVGSESYITRIYNRERIIEERDRFENILFRHIRAHSDSAESTDAEVQDIVEEVVDKIVGNSPFRVPGLDMFHEAGPLQKRTLNIPDKAIFDFLERDIEVVASRYTKAMAADVELAGKFGDAEMTAPLSKLKDEFNARKRAVNGSNQFNAAEKKTELVRLQKEYKADLEDITALRDKIRGTYAIDNVDGVLYRGAKIFKNVNYLRMLGGMTLAAMPDLARPVMAYGLTKTFSKGFLPMVTAFKTHRLGAAEVKRFGTALDMGLDTRARAMADLTEDWQRGNMLERGLEHATTKFGVVSLMAPWNAVLKQMTGTIAMDGFLRAAKAVDAGRATNKQITALASAGIDDAMAIRIWGQFRNGGGVYQRGLHISATEDWTDRVAKEAFRAAVVRDVDRVIVTPGLEKPLFMSQTLGSVVGQFKTFALSSTQRVLLAGLQKPDLAFVNGAILTLGIGGFSAWVRMQIAGVDTSNWSIGKWAAESVDRSGLVSIFSEVNNIAEKVTLGKVGLSQFTGEQASRYASRNVVSSLLGPTIGTAQDVVGTLTAAFSGKWTAADTHRLRKLLPYQNVFYFRQALDKVEKGVNEALGIPQRKKR